MSPDKGQVDPLTAPWWARNEQKPPRRFRVWPVDNSGFARAAIAEGVEFSDGTVALRWLRRWPTYVVLSDQGIGAVEAGYIGNGVASSIEWLDGAHE